jgi:CO/xanthine dehydrogenase Mo-binding subunit
VLVNIVAEILGIDPFDIRCVTGDTDLTPGRPRQLFQPRHPDDGNAAIQAADRARDLLAQAVAKKLDVPRTASSSPTRRVFDIEDPGRA